MKLTRRTFLIATATGTVLLKWPQTLRAEKVARRPNILFFLIDDQRNDTLGCAGHPIIKTPVIDRLAATGVRFRNAFVTSPICPASRASILTGLTERTHGYTFGTPPVPENYGQTSYPLLLKQAGYRTGFFGKYGVAMKVSPERMFDEFAEQDRPYWRNGRHIDEINVERAVEFLHGSSAEQPFCLSVSFSSVHAEDDNKTPGQKGHFPVIDAVKDMYQNVEIPAPRLHDPAIFENLPEFLRKSMNRQRYFWSWDTPEKYQQNMRAYFAMISGVDLMIGRVLDKLSEGVVDNTVIIYASDNGNYMGERGLAGKWSHFEQSLRIPLIIHDPRLPAAKRGHVLNPMALNLDIPATILDYAGVKIPKRYQGCSLVPLVRDDKLGPWRTDFFCEHLMNHADLPKWEGVRGQHSVYARYFEQTPPYEFLHDLKTDPDQLTNLVSNPSSHSLLVQMRKRCDELKDKYSKAEHDAAPDADNLRR
jgi:arylsulfatase A-like enzyme